MNQVGFDSEKVYPSAIEHIRERINQFGGKLYLEFGGKLFDDYHAARVLPGFAPDNKIKMLLALRDQAEIVIAINAGDIEKNKRRGDLGITYDKDVARLIDVFRGFGLYVGSIALTQYAGQPAADVFEKAHAGARPQGLPSIPNPELSRRRAAGRQRRGLWPQRLYRNHALAGRRDRAGAGQRKDGDLPLQLYHEHKRGVKAGYAKFETFPIWNLPLKHPVNLAYEAATADLNDVNMIDPFHLEAYGVTTVNYNRDIEIFPVLRTIFERIYGECPYKSPTDMGVNMAGFSIVDDEVCREASRQEVIRRYFQAACRVRQGQNAEDEVAKIELLMRTLDIEPERRAVVPAAMAVAERTGKPALAIELPDGQIVTGRTTELFGAASAAVLNALKTIAGIDDEIKLIAPDVIASIQTLKTDYMKSRNPRLHTDEMLVALAISAAGDPNALKAMQALDKPQVLRSTFHGHPLLRGRRGIQAAGHAPDLRTRL